MATSILLVDSVSSGLMKPTAMLVRSTAKEMRMASGKQSARNEGPPFKTSGRTESY